MRSNYLLKTTRRFIQYDNFKVEQGSNEDVSYYVKTPTGDQQHEYSLIWIHGLGDTGAGFIDVFIDTKMQVVPPSCKVILPTAPTQRVTANGGYMMTSWFDIFSLERRESDTLKDIRNNVDQAQILKSVGIIHKMLKEEAALLGSTDKVFVGGFSQGCAISLASFLLFEQGRLGGVVGLSGQQAAEIDWDKIDLDLKRKTKMFLYHGTDDPMLPVGLSEKTYAEFKDKKLDFTFEKEEGLEHSLSWAEIQKLTAFLHSLMR